MLPSSVNNGYYNKDSNWIIMVALGHLVGGCKQNRKATSLTLAGAIFCQKIEFMQFKLINEQ
jgi:hypothetical protein